jgi:homoserine O-acetyltransferase
MLTETLQTAEHVAALELESGAWVEAKGRVFGPSGAPPVIVLGGISASRRLIADETGDGWWPGIAGPGLALCPERQRLLSFDFLAEDAAPFPTANDQAEALIALADAAGFDRFAVVGASYGGTIALAIAAKAPDRVARLDVLCAAHRPHPMTTALRSIQRDIVRFGLARGDGAGGVDLARRIAMTTYRTHDEFEARFRDPEPGSRDADGVEAYLAARGADYAARTSPERFLALSRSMDAVEIDLSRITAPARFLAFREDRLAPLGDIEETAANIPGASVTAVSSLYGHDGFLKETGAVTQFLKEGA